MPDSYTISIFKFGGLISHYYDHSQQDSECGFISFLAAHYLDKEHHESNHCEHEKLPFHDHHSEVVNFAPQSPSLPPVPPTTLNASKLMVQSAIVIAENTTCPTSSFRGDIWQPPKA